MEELFGGTKRTIEHERGGIERDRRKRERPASHWIAERTTALMYVTLNPLLCHLTASVCSTVLAALNATYLSTLQDD